MSQKQPEKNMCDGCQRGLPIEIYKGSPLHHAGKGEIHIYCTKDQYISEKKCQYKYEFNINPNAVCGNDMPCTLHAPQSSEKKCQHEYIEITTDTKPATCVKCGEDVESPQSPVSEWEEKLKYDLRKTPELAQWWIDYFNVEFRNQTIEECAEVLEKEIILIKEGIQACKDDSKNPNCKGEELQYIFGKSQALKIMIARISSAQSIINQMKK